MLFNYIEASGEASMGELREYQYFSHNKRVRSPSFLIKDIGKYLETVRIYLLRLILM